MRSRYINPVRLLQCDRDEKSNGIKRIYYILLILILYTTTVFASTYESLNYTLTACSIIPSFGKSSSVNYIIEDACIGGPFGGVGESPNYTLDASLSNYHKTTLGIRPNPPVVNNIITPTNIPTQTLSGTKDKDTSIHINGYEAVPLDNKTSWSYEYTLIEGSNELIITSRNNQNLESDPVYVTITLDTIPPFLIINQPLTNTIVYHNPINVEGTKDGIPFTKNENLTFGPNRVTIEATDEAGNKTTDTIEVYLIREPLWPPDTQAGYYLY